MTEDEKKDIPHVDEESPLQEGADGSGVEVRKRLGLPENSEKRRKHFLKPEVSEGFTYEKDRLYEGDFFNPYIDFSSKFTPKLLPRIYLANSGRIHSQTARFFYQGDQVCQR